MTVTVSADKQRSYDGDYMDAGKRAERIVMDWLRERPEVIGLDDFRDYRAVHKYDVDIGIENEDGSTRLGEIKSDRHIKPGGNVLFEVLRINHTCHTDHACTLGWAARSPAKWLFIYTPERHEIWFCTFEDLRAAFQRYTRKARKTINITIVPTDLIKTTVCVLIPEREYCRDFMKRVELPKEEKMEEELPF